MSELKVKRDVFELFLSSKETPILCYCKNDNDWTKLFSEYNPVLIDVNKVSNSELCGTDFATKTYYEPLWLKELNNKGGDKLLLINNFDQVPPKELYPDNTDDVPFEELDCVIPGQYNYSPFWRNKTEDKELRTLNFGSPYCIPEGTVVVLICKVPMKYQLDQMIISRGCVLDLTE